MIPNTFIHFESYEKFSKMKISADSEDKTYIIPSQSSRPVSGEPDVSWNSISFIKDKGTIHTHGQFYEGGEALDPVYVLNYNEDFNEEGEGTISKEDIKRIAKGVSLGIYPRLFDGEYELLPSRTVEHSEVLGGVYKILYKGGHRDFYVTIALKEGSDSITCEKVPVFSVHQFLSVNGVNINGLSPVTLNNEKITLELSDFDNDFADEKTLSHSIFALSFYGDEGGTENIIFEYDESSKSLTSEHEYTGSIGILAMMSSYNIYDQEPVVLKFPAPSNSSVDNSWYEV